MGSGGGGGPANIGGISGQGGGRILPGAASGVGELILQTPRPVAAASPSLPDYRPNAPLGHPFDTSFAAPGGGPGAVGKGDSFAVYLVSGATEPTYPRAGGGGGWGAAGGACLIDTGGFEEPTSITSGNPGAAGGKAINTNGHAVTWLAGSARTYGAVG